MVATQQRLTKERVLQIVEEQQIEFIRIEFLDYTGVTRGRTIRKDSLQGAMEKGVNFSTAIMDFTMFDTYVPDPTYGTQGGDFLPYRTRKHLLFCRTENRRQECSVI